MRADGIMQGEANFFDEVPMSSTETPQAPAASVTAEPEAAVMPAPPVLPELPKPAPSHETAIAPAAAMGHDGKAQEIEKLLAQYVAPHVPAALAANLTVSVVLANSNAVTAHGFDPKNLHDIAIEFKGDGFNAPESSKALTSHLLEVLRSHPAFKEIVFTVPDKPAQGHLRFTITALKEEQVKALLEAPTRAAVQTATIVKDAAEVVAEATSSANQPAEVAAAHVCGDHCPEHAAKPAGLPLPQAVAPAQHEGKVAANDHKVALTA